MNTFFFDDVQYPEGLFGGKDFFNPIIYSTEEREVGVWIDNKPLYQKTFGCGALLNAQTKEVSFTEDMETATIIDAFAMSTSEGYVISLPDVVPNYVVGSVRTYVSKTEKKIYIYSQADMRTYDKSYVTIQYTKTTDVAGSGEYNALGIPNVHYDGNEKIVGTWFGETLYERTFNGLATNTNGDNWVNIGGIDATTWKDAINVEIYCNSSDVNNKLTRIVLGEARVFNGNVQVTTSVSYNREINVATIQYTKTS